MQQPLANVPVWLSKISCNQKWQLCQNQKQKSIAAITGKCAWVTDQYQLQQPLASVPKWLSKNNQDGQQSNKTGTMCPPWKTANSYNWDAVGPSRDQMINCRNQKNRNPFSFLFKKATTSVNQQMCQSTNSILDKKGAEKLSLPEWPKCHQSGLVHSAHCILRWLGLRWLGVLKEYIL